MRLTELFLYGIFTISISGDNSILKDYEKNLNKISDEIDKRKLPMVRNRIKRYRCIEEYVDDENKVIETGSSIDPVIDEFAVTPKLPQIKNQELSYSILSSKSLKINHIKKHKNTEELSRTSEEESNRDIDIIPIPISKNSPIQVHKIGKNEKNEDKRITEEVLSITEVPFWQQSDKEIEYPMENEHSLRYSISNNIRMSPVRPIVKNYNRGKKHRKAYYKSLKDKEKYNKNANKSEYYNDESYRQSESKRRRINKMRRSLQLTVQPGHYKKHWLPLTPVVTYDDYIERSINRVQKRHFAQSLDNLPQVIPASSSQSISFSPIQLIDQIPTSSQKFVEPARYSSPIPVNKPKEIMEVATSETCAQMKKVASQFGVKDISIFAKQNCSFLQGFAPGHSCEQIWHFVDSCHKQQFL